MNSLAIILSFLALVNLARSSFIGQSRVIGGAEVDIRLFPYIVSIRIKDRHFCGGSIISTDTILTAAHCMKHFGKAELTIRVGASQNAKGESFKVATVTVHEGYNPDTMQNDVALMKLQNPLTFGPTVQPIALATRRPLPGAFVTVIGWGMFDVGSKISENLRAAAIPLIEPTSCNAQYENVKIKITSQMVCAGNNAASRSSCPGDSGGPLVEELTGKLLGIVSFGQGCGHPAPGVYASVPGLMEWIVERVKVATL